MVGTIVSGTHVIANGEHKIWPLPNIDASEQMDIEHIACEDDCSFGFWLCGNRRLALMGFDSLLVFAKSGVNLEENISCS